MTTDALSIIVRRARHTDRAAIAEVEAGSTPGLRYVEQVFDLFMDATQGAFLVAEVAGEVVACGKFTLVPDGSAWLETLRVLPAWQGKGIGKAIYAEFSALAKQSSVSTMRMYTGTTNVVSKGLAEANGFYLAEHVGEARLPCEPAEPHGVQSRFVPMRDGHRAAELILANRSVWHDFLVMNRTFYKLTPALCIMLAEQGQVYFDNDSDSTIVLGARFMPQEALHIAHFSGDFTACLAFAMEECRKRQAARLNCIYPFAAATIKETLQNSGFQNLDGTLIVMEKSEDEIDEN